jgi:hypothetical protein
VDLPGSQLALLAAVAALGKPLVVVLFNCRPTTFGAGPFSRFGANNALLGIDGNKVNVWGGAVALGHPIGMTGARLILTALYELRRRGGRYAIASPCIGGGEATAVLLECGVS